MTTPLSPRQTRWAVLTAALVFYLFLGWTVFYSPIDDWRWGIDSIGLDWWLNAVYNRRYAGNFFAVVMTRSVLAKTLIMGLHMFALPLLMAVIASRRDEKRFLPLFLACNAGLLLMSSYMWRETYYWVSGFGNFVIPTVYFLVWLLILDQLDRKRTHTFAWSPVLFLLTLFLGLFLENLTVLFFGASLILAIYSLWDRKLLLPFWACLLGTGAALFLMLFHGIYTDLIDAGTAIEGYRQLSFPPGSTLPEMAAGIFRQYGRLLSRSFVGGFHLALPLAVVIARGFWSSRLRPACALAALPLALAAVVGSNESLANAPAATVASVLSWALAVLAILLHQSERRVWISRLLLTLSAPLSLLFLSATNSEPWRSQFFAMSMLILVAADLAAPLLTPSTGTALIGAAAVLLALRWGLPAGEAAACTQLRQKLTREAATSGAQTLILPTDQHQYTLWAGRNPWAMNLANCFRQLNHLPTDLTVVFLPPGSFETWPEISPAQWADRMEFGPSDEPVW